MSKSNNLKNKLSNITREAIKDSYLKIDFLIQKGLAYDTNEAKRFVNYIIFHGKASNLDIAHHCVELYNNYNDYVALEDSFGRWHNDN